MKILMVSTTPLGREGITGVISNIVGRLPAEYVVDGVAPGANDGVGSDLFASHGGRLMLVLRSAKHPFRYIKTLKTIIRDGNYDLVHIHGNSHTVLLELLAAKRAKRGRAIVHAHSTSCSSRFLHRLLSPLFFRLCRYRIACGADAGAFMFGKRDYLLLKNGIACERFAFDPEARRRVREELSLGDAIVVGHVGAFTENKNQRFIVDLIGALGSREVGKYACLLLGDGPEFGRVGERIREKGLDGSIRRVGNVPNVADYLSAMDLIVMPSRFEGFPLTLVEEQCSGLPCFASDAITREADLTGDVRFLPLSAGAAAWADEIGKTVFSDRAERSAANTARIRDAGYDSGEQVRVLCEYYDRTVKE